MPIATDAWVRISAATSPSFSKDGRTLFHLRGAGLPQVWAMDADGSNPRQLSFHDEKVAFLRRCPADDRLIWGVDAGGDERQQFVLLAPGSEPLQITDAPDVIHDFGAWSVDGARIAFACNDRDERFHDICLMELATGARVRLLEGPGILTVPSWSPDGTRLAVIEDHSSTDQRLWILDVVTGAATLVQRPSPARYASVRWTGDGTALNGLTDQDAAFMRLCRIDPATGAATAIYAPEGRDVEAWSLSPDGKTLATIENDRGYAVLRVGELGTDRPAVGGLPVGIVADLSWSPDSVRLAFTAQGPGAPPGIWLWQAGIVRPLVRPDPLAEAGIDPATFIEPRLVEWTSFDGTRIPGWFALPHGPAPAGGFPSVVWVHGGPASQTRANFRADIQMLLSQGFAVLMPNIRGSTGYGRAYLEADEVGKRPDAMADLAAGRAWLAAQPSIDPERIGIMGQSYGGWVVLAAVTLQPELWKAAVNYYGIADFVTLLERTGPWRRDHRAREYGFPGTDDALFRRISPIHHVDRVVAPVLVLHGDRDPRVPMHESDQIVQALEQRQKQVRYERFTYAGHGFIRPDHRVRVYAAVADHFVTHL
ncbi:S9 family peptidase [Limobrevibacterium gyesilva]|uniref:S9 family peptidase n=1 Tax=Limobrevibacterium gyesilva TaxID=2991712 RepID=A0AA42CEF9_9PROT|nr:S9 family peptidase [Limobrevibacterium gyesilva]MCW3473476.1 S9 family peptidase [Limobrevibacterium gyesilva]